MAANNIFRTIKVLDYSANPNNPYIITQRHSTPRNPFSNPNQQESKKDSPNKLFAVSSEAKQEKGFDLFTFLIELILTLLGKKKQWHQAKHQLYELESRISSIENAIKGYEQSNRDNSYKI